MTSGGRPVPEQGSWQRPGQGAPDPYAPDPYASDPYGEGRPTGPAFAPGGLPPAAARRGRPGIAALAVAVLELVIIAAVGNQSVTDHAVRYLGTHNTFRGRLVGSTLAFPWRFTPDRFDNHDGMHAYAQTLLSIALFVLVSALLTALVVRAAPTFWTVFLGVWAGVFAAVWVSHVLAAFVSRPPTGGSRASYAFFESFTGLTAFAGAVLGLLAGLVAGLTAVSSRRPVAAPAAAYPSPPPEPPYRAPQQPPPFYGPPPRRDDPYADAGTTALPRHGERRDDPYADAGTTALPRHGERRDERADERTAALPAVEQAAPPTAPPTTPPTAPPTAPPPVSRFDPQPRGDEPDGRTRQVPRFDPAGGQQWRPPSGGDEPTQGLPAQPGDER